VTIEMLLRHQGGFLKSGGGKHISLRLRDGIERSPADYAAEPRFYSNTSFGIFHFIYAKYAFRATTFLNPRSLHDVEVQFQNKSMNDYNKAVQDVTSMALNYGLYRHILQPLKISATCDARISSFPPSNSIKVPPNAPIEHFDFFTVAKSYSGPTSSQGKFLPGTMRNCAAGGLYMSAKDLAKFVTALGDPQFLPPAQQRLLFSNGPARDVYAFDTRTILGDRAFWKDGGRNEGGVSSIAYVLKYPTGAHAVFVANSAGSTRSVGVVLRDAYLKARGM
jgi:CubicO group peptidase (beta-lactamase class C family)